MRQNIFNQNDKLIGQNYQTKKGKWRHKWIDFRSNNGTFEPFTWSGKAKGDDMDTWTYEKLKTK